MASELIRSFRVISSEFSRKAARFGVEIIKSISSIRNAEGGCVLLVVNQTKRA